MVKCLKHLHKKYNTIIIINTPSILSIYIYIVSDEPATNCGRSMCTNAIHRCLLQPTDGLPIATTTASRVTSSNVWRLKEQESVGNVALEAVTMIYFLASYCATCFFFNWPVMKKYWNISILWDSFQVLPVVESMAWMPRFILLSFNASSWMLHFPFDCCSPTTLMFYEFGEGTVLLARYITCFYPCCLHFSEFRFW